MEKALFGLTTKDVRRLAYDFATEMGIKHRFNNKSKMAGSDWLNSFLLRHPELTIRKPQATNVARAVGFNKPQVEKFLKPINVSSPTTGTLQSELGLQHG